MTFFNKSIYYFVFGVITAINLMICATNNNKNYVKHVSIFLSLALNNKKDKHFILNKRLPTILFISLGI